MGRGVRGRGRGEEEKKRRRRREGIKWIKFRLYVFLPLLSTPSHPFPIENFKDINPCNLSCEFSFHIPKFRWSYSSFMLSQHFLSSKLRKKKISKQKISLFFFRFSPKIILKQENAYSYYMLNRFLLSILNILMSFFFKGFEIYFYYFVYWLVTYFSIPFLNKLYFFLLY